VAHGGSLVFYAGLCKALGRGRVIGVDVEIRPHNREAIESHTLAPLIELIEGDSAAPDVVAAVRARVQPGETVLVILDSNHTKEHVLAELEAYAPLVSPGSYVVAMDGHIMERAAGLPRSEPDWRTNNPKAAAAEFARAHSGFEIDAPPFLFDESLISRGVVGWAGGALRRTS
jgi:cephalosporin hydroxylase